MNGNLYKSSIFIVLFTIFLSLMVGDYLLNRSGCEFTHI